MKKLLFTIFLCIFALSVSAISEAGGIYKSGYFLVTTTASQPISISSAQEQGYAKHSALIYVEGNSCRWLVNGTPTGDLGIVGTDDTTIVLDGIYNVTNFKAILKTGTATGGVTLHYIVNGE